MKQDLPKSKEAERAKRLPLWRVVLSVVQASFGVQSSKNRERDFAQGKMIHYAITAVIFTAVFVALLIWVVGLVLDAAGG